jgi:S-adenosyl-L-methionine hydrolase (adenosine-forming)
MTCGVPGTYLPMSTITLITDFGLADGHVGAMKGIMRTIAPCAELVDVSHEIPPHDIRHAAFVLLTCYPSWPPQTVHLVVVDPGVGTERRAVAVQTGRGAFVAPDNGVLSYVLAREAISAAVSLTNPQYWHRPVSPVFHGRDILGPAAAHLASGSSLESLGEPVDIRELVTFAVPVPQHHPDGHITAHVQHIDRFGNCTTDVPSDALWAANAWQVQVRAQVIGGILRTFADVPVGSPLALLDSTGFVAIAVRNGSAAQQLGIGIGDQATLWPSSA